MLEPAIINGFINELGLIKEALSLSQLQSAGSKAIGKHMGPAGAVATSAAKTMPKSTTLRGQVVPGVANMRRDYAAVQNANEQLQGARSLL